MKLCAGVLGSLLALSTLFNIAQAKTSMDSFLRVKLYPALLSFRIWQQPR